MGPGFQGALGLTQHFFDEGARAFGVANHGELLGQIEFGVEGVVAVGGLGLGRWAGGQVQIQAIQAKVCGKVCGTPSKYQRIFLNCLSRGFIQKLSWVVINTGDLAQSVLSLFYKCPNLSL